MRVSERHRYNVTNHRVEQAKSANTDMLEKVSTQKRINHLSDDPTAVAQVVRQENMVAQNQQFRKNIDYARGFLERSETAARDLGENLIRAKELSVNMANDTYGPESRMATAREISQIMDSVVSLGNTTFGSRYVFGGFRTETPPLSRDGQYLGDDGIIYIQVEPSSFKQINVGARHLFEATDEEREKGHFDLMHTLEILHTGLEENDEHLIRTAMDELDHQLDKVSTYQAKVGALTGTLEKVYARNELSEEIAVAEISRLEDADMFKSSSDFKRTETVLQSTLMASTKLLQPSLLNFLQ